MALTQKRAAVLLAAGLLAVPLVPSLIVAATPAGDWTMVEPGQTVSAVSDDGVEVRWMPPAGWEYRDRGDVVLARSGDGSLVTIQVVDRDGRDPSTVTQRIIRRDRVSGVHAALTDGEVSAGNGSLTGPPCTVVLDDLGGACAFLADEDVVVSVDVLGTAQNPGPALGEVLQTITRSGS